MMKDPALFPSKPWFQQLAASMESDAHGFRGLGSVNCTMVVKVDDAPEGNVLYEVVFESFGVKSIRRLGSLSEASPSHFVLEAPLAVWRAMIESIQANGSADLEHTLNYLTFPDDPMKVDGPDQLEVDAFYRYNESLQRFFDGSASVPTSFA